MFTKIFYKKLVVDKSIRLQYLSNGIIIDTVTGKIIDKIKMPCVKPFFYFNLEFESYHYREFYSPKTNVCARKMTSIVYHIYLFLDIKAITKSNSILNQLCYHFVHIQNNQLVNKNKNYKLTGKYRNDDDDDDDDDDEHQHNIATFIAQRAKYPLVLFSWKFIQPSANINFAFDISSKKIVLCDKIPKISFFRKGALIETNNVKKLLANHFNDLSRSLIVVPASMINLWDSCAKILTFTDLLKKQPVQLIQLIQSNGNDNKNDNKIKINQIIIHECHVQFFPHIKKLATLLNCKTIWIINSLPLKYYFSVKNKTPRKLNISNISLLINLWLDFSDNAKFKYKTEIARFILTNLDQKYQIIHYDQINPIPKLITIKMNLTEKYIYNKLTSCYTNWLNKLTNDTNNKYSITTKTACKKIELNIFKTLISLILSVISNSDIHYYFKKKNNQSLNNCLQYNKELNSTINLIESNINIHNEDECEETIQIMKQKIAKNNILIDNYSRYLNKKFYQSLDDSTCPICYDAKVVKTKLICGHTICLECILNTLSKYHRCPLCNEQITTRHFAIIKESTRHKSYLTSYLLTLDKHTIILTDLDFLGATSYLFSVINIKNFDPRFMVKNAQNAERIRHIVVFSSPVTIMDSSTRCSLDRIINYFNLFSIKPTFSQINLALV